MSTKVIFRRAEVFVLVEVCLPRRPHAVLPRSQVLSEKRIGGARVRLMSIYFLSNIRPRLACMRTSRKRDFRSSKNNFRGHDISQGLDREPSSLSPHFLLITTRRNIHKHLLSSERCRQSCCADCFEILDSAPTKFQLKLKEVMHINWEKPNLNQQVHHVNLTLTL